MVSERAHRRTLHTHYTFYSDFTITEHTPFFYPANRFSLSIHKKKYTFISLNLHTKNPTEAFDVNIHIKYSNIINRVHTHGNGQSIHIPRL